MALNILRELFVKIGLAGAEEATRDEKRLEQQTDKTSKALKRQKKEADDLSKGLTRFGVFLSNFAANLASAGVISAMNGIQRATSNFIGLLRDSVFAASDSADMQHRLRTQLMLSGDVTEDTMKNFSRLADEMYRLTEVDDDVALGFLATAKAIGTTNEQAEQIVRTAADFSAATGEDMGSAVESLSKSLQGSAGMLARFLPQIGEFTEEQLRAGAAIDYLNSRFGGAATKRLNTFSGAFNKLKNTMGNAMEEVGTPLMEALIPAMKQLSAAIVEMMPDLRRFGGMMKEAFFAVTNGFKQLINMAGGGPGIVDKIGRFLLDVALLFEDFAFFLSGQRSWIGELIDSQEKQSGGEENTIMGRIGKFFRALGTAAGEGFVEGLKEGVKAMFGFDKKSIDQMLLEGETSATYGEMFDHLFNLDTIKENLKNLDIFGFGKSPTEGLPLPDFLKPKVIDESGKEIPSRASTPAIPVDTEYSRDQKQLSGLDKGSAQQDPTARMGSLVEAMKTFLQFAQVSLPQQSMAPTAMGGSSTSYSTQTSNDQRTANVYNEIKINTPMPADAVQRQINLATFAAFSDVVA